jgi:hypothetical protein
MPRRKPTVVFHVGAAPTACRLVEQCLLRNVELWRRSRVYGLPEQTLARDIGSGDALVADPDAFAGTLRDAWAGHDIDVIAGSCDLLGPAFGGPPGSGLHAEADAAILALAEATRPYQRAIVLSVCPQAQLLEMHYERAIAAGGTACLDEWLASVDFDNVSWLPLHRKLTAAFGSHAVTLHDFRCTDQGQVDFLRDVFAAADLELPDAVAARTPPSALRFSDTGVNLLTAANPHLSSDRERADLVTFLRWNFSELDGPPGVVLPAAAGNALHERYDSELGLLLATVAAAQGNGER